MDEGLRGKVTHTKGSQPSRWQGHFNNRLPYAYALHVLQRSTSLHPCCCG